MRTLIIGSGVVGSATGKGLYQWGHDVTFVDISPQVVIRLKAQGYQATLPYDNLLRDTNPQVILISVPTPSMPDGAVNLSFLDECLQFLGEQLAKFEPEEPVLVALRSTVPPGTTRDHVIPALRDLSGKMPGDDFVVCFHPEFLRAVSAEEDFLNAWTVVAGAEDEWASHVLRRLYAARDDELILTDFETAEFIKYACNCFNATKISFSNEIWLLASALGVDGNRVLSIASEAAEGYWNQRYGTLGGRPFGGTCLPKDTRGLLQFARSQGLTMPLLQGVIEVNRQVMEIAQPTIEGPNWEKAPRRRVLV